MPYAIFAHIPGGRDNLNGPELRALFSLLEKQDLAATVFYDGLVRTPEDFAEMMEDDFCWFYLVCRREKNILLHRTFEQEGERSFSSPANPALSASFSPVPPMRGYRPMAFCWLNNHSGGGAMIHFGVFRHALGEAGAMGRFVTRMLLLARGDKAAPRAVCSGTSEDVRAYIKAGEAARGGGYALEWENGAGRKYGDTAPGWEYGADEAGTRTVGGEKDRRHSSKRPGPGYCLDALYGMTPSTFRHALAFVEALGFRRAGELPFAARLRRGGKERLCGAVLTCLTREDMLSAPGA